MQITDFDARMSQAEFDEIPEDYSSPMLKAGERQKRRSITQARPEGMWIMLWSDDGKTFSFRTIEIIPEEM